jgi:multidrug efflux pump subunit AcrA (membrane-fusion protein)
MNLILVAFVSVILATGVFNTEPKGSEGNKKTEIIVKESSETKLTEEQLKAEAQAQAEAEAKAVAEAQAQAEAEAKAAAEAQAQAEAEAKAAAEAQAQAEAEAKAAAEAQEESKKIDSSKDSGINYLKLALYIFGSILVISIGTYFYFRQRDNLSSRSVTRTPDSPRRDFRKEVAAEPQEEQPTQKEIEPEPQEEQPTQEEVKPEPQEQSPEDEKK